MGRVPGDGSTRTWAPMPPSLRPPQVPGAWVGSWVIEARNSSIHSEVSVRTMSETSSQNRRSTPRHRSAASPAVPSVGPSTSRTHSEAQSNWKASRRRCSACAVDTSRIQPEVRPNARSVSRQAAARARPT